MHSEQTLNKTVVYIKIHYHLKCIKKKGEASRALGYDNLTRSFYRMGDYVLRQNQSHKKYYCQTL